VVLPRARRRAGFQGHRPRQSPLVLGKPFAVVAAAVGSVGRRWTAAAAAAAGCRRVAGVGPLAGARQPLWRRARRFCMCR
jgi:hypothetical protein